MYFFKKEKKKKKKKAFGQNAFLTTVPKFSIDL